MTTTQVTVSLIDVEGVVDTVTHANHESGYAVLKLRVDRAKYKNHPCVNNRGVVTLIGALARFGVGEKLKVQGPMRRHQKYGPQVEVQQVVLMEPKNHTEIQRYLSKNVFGIGEKLAKIIVEKYGTDTLTIIDQDPDQLAEIRGIDKKRLAEIKKKWEEQKQYRQLLVFCTQVGISTTYLERVYKKYGDRAIQKISQDPYSLARDVDGIGFKKADEVARHLGIHEISEVRIRAAAEFFIGEQANNKGHCFVYLEEVVQTTTTFLNHPEINKMMVQQIVDRAVRDGLLKQEGNRIYLPALAKVEDLVAFRLRNILVAPLPQQVAGQTNITKILEAAANALKITLDATQCEAIYKTLTNKVHVITGGPGTGKTTITKAVVAGFWQSGLPIHLMAPTGRAAKRMTEVIGIPAQTIHRLLFSLDKAVREGHSTVEQVQLHGIVIVDEFSMVDVKLFAWLLKFLAEDVILVIVGDQDQLPSVSAGAVLRDLLKCPAIPSTKLTHIFRQAQASQIVVNAHKINQGIMPQWDYFGPNHGYPVHSDMWLTMIEDAEAQSEAAVWVATEICKWKGWDPKTDCMVLAPMKTGGSGVYNLNAKLQRALNPNPPRWVNRVGDVRWGIGDRMMQLRNNYQLGIMNGDQGVIVDMTTDTNMLKGLKLECEGDLVTYDNGEDWSDLTLAYSSTIHKVQGSEYKMVVICLHSSHYVMLLRNLLYTGVTRGKELVVLIASGTALSRAIATNDVAQRNTYLAEKICQRTQPL